MKGVMSAALRAADASHLVEGSKRSALGRRGDLSRAFALLGDDIDDAADRVRTVKATLRPAQYLHAVDVRGENLAEVEGAGRRARIADVDAVHQHLRMVGSSAAHEHGCHIAWAGLLDEQAR